MELDMLRSHLTNNLDMFQHAVPYLKQSNAPRMILATAWDARVGNPQDDLAHTAAKGAIISMTMSEAAKLAPYGITVNAVAIGGIQNLSVLPEEEALLEQVQDDAQLRRRIPLKRLPTPQDVAAAVCFLASEEAGFITGEILNVSGGLAMG